MEELFRFMLTRPAQRADEIRPRSNQRRSNSKKHAAYRRESNCEDENPRVEVNLGGLGETFGRQCQQPDNAPPSQHDAADSASQAEENAFRQ